MSLYGREVRKRMFVQDRRDQTINAYTGLTAESGEVADYYKKLLFHPPHPRNPTKEDLRKELGDVLWYLATVNEIEFGDSLLDVAKENIRKLQARWPERYGDVDLDNLTL